MAKLAGVQTKDYAHSIMGATEKRRESGAVCRDMGGLSQRGEWRAVYQERIVGEICGALLITFHVTFLRMGYAEDMKAGIASDIFLIYLCW